MRRYVLLVLCLSIVLTLFASTSVAAAPWSTLFGMSPSMQLESIDPSTGQPIEIAAPLKFEAQGQGVSTIDPIKGVFYIVGTNLSSFEIALVGTSTSSGQIVSETVLPFLLEGFVGVGQFCSYDPNNRDVIAIGRDKVLRNQHTLLRVNSDTGKVKVVAKVGDFALLELLGGSAVFDTANNVEWFMLALNDTGRIFIRLYGYDGDSGVLLNVIDNPYNMASMVYDPRTELIWGFGIRVTSDNKYMRTLVTLDSRTSTFTQLGDVPGWVIMLGAVGAIDSRTHTLYGYIEPSTSSSTLKLPPPSADGQIPWELLNPGLVGRRQSPFGDNMNFDLVGVSLDSKQVTSHPHACDITQCPWNLQSI